MFCHLTTSCIVRPSIPVNVLLWKTSMSEENAKSELQRRQCIPGFRISFRLCHLTAVLPVSCMMSSFMCFDGAMLDAVQPWPNGTLKPDRILRTRSLPHISFPHLNVMTIGLVPHIRPPRSITSRCYTVLMLWTLLCVTLDSHLLFSVPMHTPPVPFNIFNRLTLKPLETYLGRCVFLFSY